MQMASDILWRESNALPDRGVNGSARIPRIGSSERLRSCFRRWLSKTIVRGCEAVEWKIFKKSFISITPEATFLPCNFFGRLHTKVWAGGRYNWLDVYGSIPIVAKFKWHRFQCYKLVVIIPTPDDAKVKTKFGYIKCQDKSTSNCSSKI